MPSICTSQVSSSKPSNPLNYEHQRFNIDLLRGHSDELALAGRAMNRAHQAAYAIECIMSILTADDGERDREEDGGQPLTLYLRGGLTAAIANIATGLHSELDREASAIEKMVQAKQGGAA